MRMFTGLLALLMMAVTADAASTIAGDLPRTDSRPLESFAELDADYGVVTTSEGVRLRSIVTRPRGAAGPLPAIFVTQWVSCGSIEFRATGDNLLRDLALRSGLAMIRVERAGSGDSEGPTCSALDYDTEVRHYREAFDALARHPWVDPARIVVHGISLGATTAPLVADGKPVAGLLVRGGGAVSHLERMMGFDRLNLDRSGRFPADQRQREMLRRIEFQQHYLIGRMEPAAIEARYPHLKGVWASLLGTSDAPHYGRPFAWHWQAAARDFAGAWARIDAPVMAVYGEHDQFEMRHGHKLIVDIANARRPGSGTWLEIAGGDHDLMIYPDAAAAYAREGGERHPERFLGPAIKWLREVTRLATPPG